MAGARRVAAFVFVATAAAGACRPDDEPPPIKEELTTIDKTCGAVGEVVTVHVAGIDACNKVELIFNRRVGGYVESRKNATSTSYKQNPVYGIDIFGQVPEFSPPTLEGQEFEVIAACHGAELAPGAYDHGPYTQLFKFSIPCPDAGTEPAPEAGADTAVMDSALDTYEASVDSAMESTVVDSSVEAEVGSPEEVCDGVDNDGDGLIDEGCPLGFTIIDFWGSSPNWGYVGTGIAGSSTGSALCPYPSAIVGICGRSDDKGLTALNVKCAAMSLKTDKTVTPWKYSIDVPEVTDPCASMFGSSTVGSVFNTHCPPGSVLEEIRGKHGTTITDRIGEIQMKCVSYGLERSAGNVWKVIRAKTELMAQWGPGTGTAFTPWAPPDHTSGTPAFIRGIAVNYVTGTDARIFTMNATGRTFTLIKK
jgi:hypothetical protein